jgi:hypothetical protein
LSSLFEFLASVVDRVIQFLDKSFSLSQSENRSDGILASFNVDHNLIAKFVMRDHDLLASTPFVEGFSEDSGTLGSRLFDSRSFSLDCEVGSLVKFKKRHFDFSFKSELKEFFGEVPRRSFVGKLSNPVVSLSGVEDLDAIPAKDESVSVRELDTFDHVSFL